MSKMYLMVGCAGAGKSSFIKEHIKPNEIVISRDKIRLSMIQDGDTFFIKEDKVYKEFISQINAAITANLTFYVDQTSLNQGSRSKLLSHLEKKPDKIIAIYIKKPLEIIRKQNAQRTGLALVPEKVIDDMYRILTPPTKKEGFDEIWTIE